jgi:glycosyltransferase involved in cell wall biosynthesis
MRIVFVIQKLAGLRGGAERVVVDLANGLTERGHDVTIVTYEPNTSAPGYELRGVRRVDVSPRVVRVALLAARRRGRSNDGAERRVSTHGNTPKLARVKWQLTHGWFARRLERWLDREAPDVIVGFLPPAISAVAVAGQRMGSAAPRTIASTHNVPSEDFGPSPRWDQNPIARETNLWALGAVDAVTVLQPEFVDQLPARARALAVVVPNAVTRLAEATLTERRNRIVGVGRLTDIKQYEILVRSFAMIADEFSDWDVEIYGEGPERQRLEACVVGVGLSDRVRFAGTTDAMAEVYDGARVLAHPARFEGFGLSVAEAILHGVDVLAWKSCPGVDRLVEHGMTGLLLDEGDDEVASFSRGLHQLITEPATDAQRSVARERLAARLAPDLVYEQWEQILAGTEA